MPTDVVRSAGSRADLSDPILYLLLFSVLAAPAALGAVDAWVWSAQALVAGIALAAWAAHVALGHPPAVGLRRLAFPAILFAVAVAWAAVQASGWSPTAWHHPLWAMAAETLGSTGIGAISLAPTDTSDAVLRLCGYAAVFYLAVNLCRDRRRARLVLQAVAVMVTLYAA